MPAFKGRSIAFLWGGVAIQGVREKGITRNGDPIDISSDDSLGWRELLDLSAEDQVDIKLSGVVKSEQLRKDWHAGARTKIVTITYPDNSVISGTFYLNNFGETGVYNDATTFEGSLQSTGAVTYTPAS